MLAQAFGQIEIVGVNLDLHLLLPWLRNDGQIMEVTFVRIKQIIYFALFEKIEHRRASC